MALRKIQSAVIADASITSAKIADQSITANDIVNDIAFNGSVIRVPTGNTASRPSSPLVGHIRYNTTTSVLEQYTTDGWVGIEPAPTVTGFTYPNSQTAVWQGDTITINGTGFRVGVVVKFLNPATGVVTVADTTTRISSTQITATFPTSVSAEGTYSIVVTNPSGLGASLDNVLTADGLPIWSTSSGSLGTYLANTSMSYSLIVSEDAATPTLTITSGALPSGLTLNSSGVISGVVGDVSADTVYNFTILATDSENQQVSRSFSMSILENYIQTSSLVLGGE